jgi:hypothetical protein
MKKYLNNYLILFVGILMILTTSCGVHVSQGLCPAYGNDMYVNLDYDKSETKASI